MGSPFRPDILGPAGRDEVIGRILPTFIQAHLENHEDHQVIVLGQQLIEWLVVPILVRNQWVLLAASGTQGLEK